MQTKLPTSRDRDAAPGEPAVYWFAHLETAIQKCDFRLAVEAQKHLRRLGYDVAILKPLTQRGAR